MATQRILLPLLGGNPDPTNPPTVAWSTAARPYLIFDGTTDQHLHWGGIEVPSNYASGLTVRVKYSMNTATTNNVAIFTQTQADADGEDVETDAWSTLEASADQAVPGTATHAKTITDELTTPTIASNDYLAIRIGRENGTSGTNASGQMFWWAASLEYTTT